MLKKLLLLLLLGGCVSKTTNIISLAASDGISIAGTFLDNGSNAVVMLHMLGYNRDSWNDLADELIRTGLSILSIDFRGHGASGLSWTSFKDEDFNNMILDVKAAHEFLKGKGKNLVGIAGASIGANIAMEYSAQYNISKVILLSPGLDYKGVEISDSVKKYNGKILMVSSKDDAYSYESSETLYLLNSNSELVIYERAGHGTNMFAKQPDLKDKIINFLIS